MGTESVEEGGRSVKEASESVKEVRKSVELGTKSVEEGACASGRAPPYRSPAFWRRWRLSHPAGMGIQKVTTR